MSPKTRFILAVTVGAAVIAFVVSFLVTTGGRLDGSWSSADRQSFIGSCVEKCRAAPGVTADRFPMCDKACGCAADEGQKLMTGSQLGAAAQAITSGTATEEQRDKMNRIQTARYGLHQSECAQALERILFQQVRSSPGARQGRQKRGMSGNGSWL